MCLCVCVCVCIMQSLLCAATMVPSALQLQRAGFCSKEIFAQGRPFSCSITRVPVTPTNPAPRAAMRGGT